MLHTPVLFNEVLEYLDPKPGQKFIDATIDGGGHGLAIAEKIQPRGKLLGIEWDNQLLKQLEFKIQNSKFKINVTLVNDSYINLKNIAEREGFLEADGILFDFGMSSWHLEQSGKGFSFQKDEMLDMRFGNNTVMSALEMVNTLPEEELAKIIEDYGEEKFAENIARSIAEARKRGIIKTTGKLAEIIKNSVPKWYAGGRLNPATKTFQALRVAVNDELENIAKGLDTAVEVLKIGGKLAVISFHSLEDRVIKQKLKNYKKSGLFEILTKKTIKPRYEEIKSNPRARSAKLRICQKI